MSHYQIYLIIFLPAMGVLVNGLMGYRFSKRSITAIALGSVGVPLLISLGIAWNMLFLSAECKGMTGTMYCWLSDQTYYIDIGFLLDPLALVMVLVVLVIGFIIHCYSVRYMKDDPGYRRFFVYLNLFIFFMLILVTADNLVLLFVGWEGVGLCSYLLIGFWYDKKSAADAGRKAFIVNRIGDCGFILGIILTILTFHTVNFSELKTILMNDHAVSTATVSLISFFLFMGAMGKSAQFPLHVWLPDAMEGPTPVSALIHAATMVNAGVYFMCRIFPVLEQAAHILPFIAAIGLVTAMYAALSALGQRDIKRVLAYSTISQIGFMFMAIGSGIYAAGIFHLVTHGFFKGLLFLGAGAVMHALEGELDIHNMGGLSARLPMVTATFFLGILALAGIFPLSGFFSKDAILWGAFERYGVFYWGMGLCAALITVLYCGKLFGVAFLGNTRFKGRIHKQDSLITIPLAVLACFTLLLGVLGLPMFSEHTIFAQFVEPSFFTPGAEKAVSSAHSRVLEMIMTACVLVGVIFTFSVALRYFTRYKDTMMDRAVTNATVGHLLFTGFGMDKLYHIMWVRPFQRIAHLCDTLIDRFLIDGGVNGTAKLAAKTGNLFAALQAGYVRFYAVSIVFGIFVFVGVTFVVMS
jgi:NADH-quinone oxidoreductase subunit L